MTLAWTAPARLARRAKAPDRAPDFRELLGEAAWLQLPPDVRTRFDPAAHGRSSRYDGAMDVRCSWAGWLIAQACRLAGTPIAPGAGREVPVSAAVRPGASGGLVWERTYAFAGAAPVMVSSRKVMGEDGTLLEMAPGGVGMRLRLTVEDGALVFRSLGYVLKLGRRLVPIPAWLTPGAATCVHRDLGAGRFWFGMSFVHPLFGETFSHGGTFRDPRP